MRFWFLKRPDFGKTEERVKQVLAEPEFAEWFEFMGFTHTKWMADLDVRHRQQVMGGNWRVVVDLTKRISAAEGLPCWCYRMLADADNPSLIIGSGFGIGYSTGGCVPNDDRKTEQQDGQGR